MAAKKKAATKRRGTTGKKVRLRAMDNTAAIAKGDKHYSVDADGSVDVPSSEVKDFLKMGCSRLK